MMSTRDIYNLHINNECQGAEVLKHERNLTKSVGLVWNDWEGPKLNKHIFANIINYSIKHPALLIGLTYEHGDEFEDGELLMFYIQNGRCCSFECKDTYFNTPKFKTEMLADFDASAEFKDCLNTIPESNPSKYLSLWSDVCAEVVKWLQVNECIWYDVKGDSTLNVLKLASEFSYDYLDVRGDNAIDWFESGNYVRFVDDIDFYLKSKMESLN